MRPKVVQPINVLVLTHKIIIALFIRRKAEQTMDAVT